MRTPSVPMTFKPKINGKDIKQIHNSQILIERWKDGSA